MLYFHRIRFFEGININKTNISKEYDTCQYWCFLDNGFTFQQHVCNRCHDVLMVSINLQDIAVLNIKRFIMAVLSTELTRVKL